jgi:hypothetical protein
MHGFFTSDFLSVGVYSPVDGSCRDAKGVGDRHHGTARRLHRGVVSARVGVVRTLVRGQMKIYREGDGWLALIVFSVLLVLWIIAAANIGH